VKVEAAVDERGAPLLLAAVTVVPTRSGNSAHDVASGEFGSTGRRKKDEPQAQPDPARGSEQRRRDAVVDAARTLSDLTPAGVEAFVRKRWRGTRVLTREDIEAFAADARRQRVHDVADALDYRIRKAVSGRAASRVPHVSIPRGLRNKSLAGLDREELLIVFQRLRDRGWSNQEIKRHGVRRLDSDGRMRSLLG
jgi:hypothetical protein